MLQCPQIDPLSVCIHSGKTVVESRRDDGCVHGTTRADFDGAVRRTPDGVPALHGVAHQISEEQMERIKQTEGGGGNKDMGAHPALGEPRETLSVCLGLLRSSCMRMVDAC